MKSFTGLLIIFRIFATIDNRSIYTKCSKIFLIQNILQYYNNIKGFTENFDLKLF